MLSFIARALILSEMYRGALCAPPPGSETQKKPRQNRVKPGAIIGDEDRN